MSFSPTPEECNERILSLFEKVAKIEKFVANTKDRRDDELLQYLKSNVYSETCYEKWSHSLMHLIVKKMDYTSEIEALRERDFSCFEYSPELDKFEYKN